MYSSDPFACVNREALRRFAEPCGLWCFFIDTLGDPGPAPVGDGEAYRPDVKETIAWYPGRREVIKLLYHAHVRSVAFLSASSGRGPWAGLDQRKVRALSVTAGYTVGCFVDQYHPGDHLLHFPNPKRWRDPAILGLANSPAVAERLPVVARLMLAVSATKVYPQRTCVVGRAPDDAYTVGAVRRLLHADIDFCPAEEFFHACLLTRSARGDGMDEA